MPVEEASDAAAEEGTKATIIGVGNFGKHTVKRSEVGTKATFAALSAVSVRKTEKDGVPVATVEGGELGGYAGDSIITVSAF